MAIRRATAFLARRGAAAAWLACVPALASPAFAQEVGSDPFGFLRPWIERQLFGEETPEPVPPEPGSEVAPAESPEPAPPATGEGSPDQPAATEGAAAEPLPDDESQVPAGLEEAVQDMLRGPAVSSDDPASATLPDIPPGDPAGTEPGTAMEPTAEPPLPAPLRFAVLAGRSISATMAAVGPVADELAARLGRPVEILPLASYGAMIDAQVQRRVDGGFYSAAAYAIADTRCACLEPLVAPRASDGTLAYHAIIVARANSGIASAADLAGKTVAIGAADSLGARRVQLAGLMSEGVDPATFGGVLEVESAEAAIGLVAAGVADAAFAWSSLAGAVEGGYSRGTLSNLVAAGEITMGNLAIVWRSPAVGHGPFAVLRTVPEEEKQELESYFVALAATNPAAYDALDPFYGGGYAPVDPQDYAGLGTLLAQDVDAVSLPGGPATTGATSLTPGAQQPAGAQQPD